LRARFDEGTDPACAHRIAGEIDAFPIDRQTVGEGVDQVFECLGVIAPEGIGGAEGNHDEAGMFVVDLFAGEALGSNLHLADLHVIGPGACSMEVDEKGKRLLQPLELGRPVELKDETEFFLRDLDPLPGDTVREGTLFETVRALQVGEMLPDKHAVALGQLVERDVECPSVRSAHLHGGFRCRLHLSLERFSLRRGPRPRFRMKFRGEKKEKRDREERGEPHAAEARRTAMS
jgi:hypothetical protein